MRLINALRLKTRLYGIQTSTTLYIWEVDKKIHFKSSTCIIPSSREHKYQSFYSELVIVMVHLFMGTVSDKYRDSQLWGPWVPIFMRIWGPRSPYSRKYRDPGPYI